MTVYEKMRSGQLYFATDETLIAKQAQCLELQYEYNLTRPTEWERRWELLTKMFAEVGEGTYIEPPLHANWGGHHVHLGSNIYANAGLKLVDDTHIYIGDCTMLGPNVVLATAGHPIDPELRSRGLQYNLPVRIGKNCWLGAGVIVMPGITIGDNTVIGAGNAAMDVCRTALRKGVRYVNCFSLTDKVAAEDISHIFYIEFSNHLVADSIAEAPGTQTGMFRPCHNVSKVDLEQGATYLSLMQNNLDILKTYL